MATSSWAPTIPSILISKTEAIRRKVLRVHDALVDSKIFRGDDSTLDSKKAVRAQRKILLTSCRQPTKTEDEAAYLDLCLMGRGFTWTRAERWDNFDD